ncbi:MAG: glycosyltransferase [Anaerolineae bacterium]|nr:glycosyltransferase [Anaerolineae bacterium]MDW8172962.1 glycosyltransferase [Anaerolineae bacterium]
MSEPIVSIVLPTMNGERFIAHAIQSVLDQTEDRWELIIVDSNSEDRTPQIIADYAARDHRIRLLCHPKEEGRLPGALNAGFAQARGRYFTWLADDNILYPQTLARLSTFLDYRSEVGLVYSHFNKIDAHGYSLRMARRLPPRYLTYKNVVTPSFLYRREVDSMIGGYRRETFLAEDYDFWLRAKDVTNFALLPEALHGYRFHPYNLTATAGRLAIDKAVLIAIDHALDTCRWLARGQARGELAWQAYELAARHHLPDSARYWREAWRHAPLFALRRTLKTAIPKPVRERLGRRDGGYL